MLGRSLHAVGEDGPGCCKYIAEPGIVHSRGMTAGLEAPTATLGVVIAHHPVPGTRAFRLYKQGTKTRPQSRGRTKTLARSSAYGPYRLGKTLLPPTHPKGRRVAQLSMGPSVADRGFAVDAQCGGGQDRGASADGARSLVVTEADTHKACRDPKAHHLVRVGQG